MVKLPSTKLISDRFILMFADRNRFASFDWWVGYWVRVYCGDSWNKKPNCKPHVSTVKKFNPSRLCLMLYFHALKDTLFPIPDWIINIFLPSILKKKLSSLTNFNISSRQTASSGTEALTDEINFSLWLLHIQQNWLLTLTLVHYFIIWTRTRLDFMKNVMGRGLSGLGMWL